MFRWIRKRRWVWILLLIVGLGLILIARPVGFLVYVAVTDRDRRAATPVGSVDDVSRLNATPVEEVWDMPVGEDGEEKLRAVLARARRDHLGVSIAGARHSMGGQTIYPKGIQINMLPFDRMTLDEAGNLLEVGAGAKWSEVIPFLDGHRRSVSVMQSNNSFSVGGSLSVNCHGWQPGRPPIASTVESFRIMLGDGKVLRCSRGENQELFSLALGGYGLMGIILDARLHVVANERYQLQQYIVPTGDFLAAWDEHVGGVKDVGMGLGRLCVVPEDFLNEAIVYSFRAVPTAEGELPGLSGLGLEELSRTLFRGSVESDYGKKLRWEAETKLLTHVAKEFYTRNQLLNEPAEILANRTADSTDILQEYFVPRTRLQEFVGQMRGIIPRSHGDLLNVTLRDVRADSDTLLRYADKDMIALVLLFNERLTAEGESSMRELTQRLIDAALGCDGRYYLPYRLEATSEQFYRAYPQARHFFELKRKYDPGELFQNEMYLKYGKGSAGD